MAQNTVLFAGTIPVRVREADWQRGEWKSNVVTTDLSQFYREM